MSCNFTINYIKISSRGLMIKHEQFDLNYSTKHIISQKLFFLNTILGNSETLGYYSRKITNCRFTLRTQISRPFLASYNPQHDLWYKLYQLTTQQPVTATDTKFGFHKFKQFGPMFWDRSNGRSRPHTNRNII